MATKSKRETVYELAELDNLIYELNDIRSDVLKAEAELGDKVAALPRAHRSSAMNLLHYIALRQRDIRKLQEKLASLGLSSLGRTESHVLASLDAVLRVLQKLKGSERRMPPLRDVKPGFAEGRALLEEHTEALLGSKPAGRDVRIMVTMPSQAARDYRLVRELLRNGMDLMRINCAYDDADSRARMISNLRRASKKTGKDCRVLMDLAGPKLRTGPVEPGPEVIKWRPRRDDFGNVTAPARVWLTSIDKPEPPPLPADACLPVPADWLAGLYPGMTVKFFDARGSSRSINIVERAGEGRWAESFQTAYVSTGTTLFVSQSSASGRPAKPFSRADVGSLPPRSQAITLKRGDRLVLTRALLPGRPATYDNQGALLSPAMIGVTLPEIFSDVRPGEAIWLDDGEIGGVIKYVDEERIEVGITHARPRGEKLRADKGINLPDSELRLPAL
ncbi:MAG TPA: pyruvate kinase, partial [Blastocatellia bacterium]|nr:pyruvate kinase [Blastocatellia bacterium]